MIISPGAPGDGDLETLTLNLTGAFTATDFDGDAVPLAADAIQVVVENDVPAATTVPASINVFEDALSVAAGGDLSTGILDNDGNGTPDVAVNADEATITNAMLQAAVTPGADENVGGGVTFALNTFGERRR